MDAAEVLGVKLPTVDTYTHMRVVLLGLLITSGSERTTVLGLTAMVTDHVPPRFYRDGDQYVFSC